MVVQHHMLVSICLTLVFVTSTISEPISTPPSDHHRQFDVDERTTPRASSRNRGRAVSRDSGRKAGRSRTGGGSSNCDPLYQYLFGICGQWPFPRNSQNNPFTTRTPSRRPPPIPPPLIPSPPPIAQPPPPPLVPSPPPPSPSPPPPLVPSPPPPDPSPPPLVLSPPPDYILPPAVPELPPDDPSQTPPWVPISFSPPDFDINPPPLVPISFSPPIDETNPPDSSLFPPLVPIFTPPVESTMPFPGTEESPEIVLPPPAEENPITERQPLLSTP